MKFLLGVAKVYDLHKEESTKSLHDFVVRLRQRGREFMSIFLCFFFFFPF